MEKVKGGKVKGGKVKGGKGGKDVSPKHGGKIASVLEGYMESQCSSEPIDSVYSREETSISVNKAIVIPVISVISVVLLFQQELLFHHVSTSTAHTGMCHAWRIGSKETKRC